jgi:hypothetical protein
MARHVWMIVIGGWLAVFGVVNLARPRLGWRIRLFGGRWAFAGPDRLEPSDAFLTFARVSGVLTLIIAAVFVWFGVAGVGKDVTVDTSPYAPGGVAVRVDREIRHRAATSRTDPRDRALAGKAIAVVVDSFDPPCDHLSSPGCDAPPPGRLQGAISPADEYPSTGHITITGSYWTGRRTRSVCLTVAKDPARPGQLAYGECPGT